MPCSSEPETLQVVDDHPVVPVGQRLRGQTLLIGLHQDGRAVLVGAGDHEHVVTGHAHVPAEDVGRDPEAGHMTDVARAVGVGPGDRGEDVTHG